MLNTSCHRKITNVGIKSVMFTCRLPFRISCLTRNAIRDAKNIAVLISQNACLEHMQKKQKLIINFRHFMVNNGRWC